MFSEKTFLGGNQKHVQLLPQTNLQEILIEMEDQSDTFTSKNSPKDAIYISNLYEYFVATLNNSTSPVQHFQCYYCKESYLFFKALYNHAHLVHGDSASNPLKCFICQQLFVFTNEYYDHLSSNHQIRYPEAICDICLTTFMDTEALQNHLQSHPADYTCKHCSIKFRSRDLLTIHQQYHNCSKELTCSICAASFQSKFLQGLHSLRHRQVECPLALSENCTSVRSELELVNHFKEYHQLKDCAMLLKTIEIYDKEEVELKEILKGGTNISLNDQSFHYDSWLSKIQLKQDIQCLSCSTHLTSVFQLCTHLLKIHSNTKKCPFCGKLFKESPHILFHLGSKCCKAKFISPLTCSQCEETFEQQEKLLEHQLSHVKPLQCCKCNAIFQKTSELKRHLQGHGLLPEFPDPLYICPVCSSQWPSFTHLRRHIRTHADCRPFQCESCGATFKRQQALRAHLSSAHSEKSVACPHCRTGSTFRSKQALFLHVCRVHGRLRRFVCGLCAKPWPQNQDLRRHLSNVHKVEYPPLKSWAAKAGSFKSVHVIPGIENVAEGDPLRLKIAAIIEEEKEKLRSLNTDLDARILNPEDANPEDIQKTSDLASNKTPPTSENINFSCALCDFQCKDFKVWINHNAQHQQPSTVQLVNEQQCLKNQPVSDHLVLNSPSVSDQLTLNSQSISDTQPFNSQVISDQVILNSQPVCSQLTLNSQPLLDFTLVPVVPVQPVFLSPVIPINYGSLVTVIPTQDNLTTVNEPYIPIPERPVEVPETLNNLLLPRNEEIIDNSTNAGELININGMFIRIEQTFGADIVRNTVGPSIRIESSSFNDHNSTENALPENGDKGNDFVVTAESNLAEKANKRIAESVNAASAEAALEFSQQEPLQFAEPSHPQKSAVTDTAGTWSCQQCGKVLSTSKNVKRHMRIHSGERPFKCEVCAKMFAEFYNLKIHMLSHTQERPHSCNICGKTMRYLKEYVEHKKKHQGVKDCSCSVCGRSFVRQRELVRHQKLHSSEKKYQCGKCLKSFLRLDYLRSVHMPQVHGNFPCTLCKRRFESEEKLKEHQRSCEETHEEASRTKRISCPLCEKTFARKMGLKSHLQLHSNAHAAVRCYACPRKFATMETMLDHLGKFHKKWRDDIEEKKRTVIENVSPGVQAENTAGEVYIHSIENILTLNVDSQNPCVIASQ